MNAAHEDAVLGFDLDFLHPTANNIPAQALKQRYIGQIKKRIVRVDALNSHYNSLKQDLFNKNRELDLIRKKLESTNQEHTQTSLEYKELLENFSKCELECRNLKIVVNNYQEKYQDAENRVQAGKSHVVQLQQLVKEYEGKIEILQQNERRNSEKTLRESIEKELLQWKKKYKKDIAEWRTKCENLRKEIEETKTAADKLRKQTSPNSEKIKRKMKCDSITNAEDSENEDEISLDYTSQFDTQNSQQHNKSEMIQNSITNNNNTPMEVDSFNKIERISVDTGCGSSLASSDNEKWLHSPDYYFSPINGENVNKIRSSKLVDTATSPILSVNICETATSPIPTMAMINVAISPIPSVVMVNVATSPINIQSETCKESEHQLELNINNVELTEPNNNIVVTEGHCPVQIIEHAPFIESDKKSKVIVQRIPDIDIKEKQTKDFLQLNSSNIQEVDSNNDHEIEMILSNMRLDHKLITPIPKTPRKIGFNSTASQTHDVHNEYSSNCTCPDAAIAKNVSEAAREEAAQAKEEIAKTKASQKVLLSNFANVMKEMVYIKSFLKSRFSMPATTLENLNDSIPENYHNLFESTNLSDNSVKQTESVKPPTSTKLAPDSVITVISEQIIKPSEVEHVKGKQVENEILPHSVQEIIPEKCVQQNEKSKRIDSVMCLNSSAEKETVSPTKGAKGRSVKKLTNLAKYRHKCQVRNYKIKRETPPLKKRRINPKQIPRRDVKMVTRNDTLATLNDQQVYAKAVKVMAELNALSAKDSVETTLNTKVEQIISAVKEHYNGDECKTDSKSESMQPNFSSGFTSPIPKIISPIPEKTPPTPTILRRRSTKSSKLIDTCSDTAITSRNLTNTSPIPVLRSPNRTIVSSTPTKISSLHVISSPTSSITPPRRSSRLLEFAAISPTSPVTSPNSHSVSKRLLFTSPKRDSTIPVITSPTPTIPSPKLVKTVPTMTAGVSKNAGNFETTLPNQLSDLLSPTYNTDKEITLTQLEKIPTITTVISKNASNFETTLPNQNSVLSSTITLPRLGKAPTITADINRNTNSFETALPNENSVPLHKEYKPVKSSERKRKLSNSSDIQSKRVLRSSVSQSLNTKEREECNKEDSSAGLSVQDVPACHPKESILCSMIEKYGIKNVRPPVRRIPDAVLKSVSNNIDQFMSRILEGPMNKDNSMMTEFVKELQTYDCKVVVAGLTKYLTNPERKIELFGKIASPPAPQMTKSEAVILFVIKELKSHWQPVDMIETLLCSLEHTLFKLNRTPEFEVIESVSHFYALLCRYFGLQSRLKVFMLDAMYCILFKSAPLIKECLEVWPHIIPLAHMTAAKTPLITIFVFLLHFYKCEDRYSRVQDIRNILQRKYSYQVTEWNEGRILELVGNSICELRDISCEKKILRIAIIILAKRNGPRWTQNNIMKRLFQFIEKESLPEHVIEFCVSLIGPLVKPFSIDMKVHTEIALNQLVNVLDTTVSRRIKEASISSMLIMSRHNTQRVNDILLSRKMEIMSPELAEMFRVHIRMKTLNAWLKHLSRPSITN